MFTIALLLIGKDPLLDKLDGKDINSVAGVLKLYFRELRDPLFPFHMFSDLMACSSNCNFNSQLSHHSVFVVKLSKVKRTYVCIMP